jgi:hypothetical protein
MTKIALSVAAACVAALVAVNLPDIRRYLKIRGM